MKKLKMAALILLILVVVFVWLSPYHFHGNSQLKIVETIEIKTNGEKLYAYLGRSANAVEWSSYVSHIEPLNEGEYRDGEVGSTRRCYKKDNENVQWDEKIEIANASSYRQLSIYNLKDFPLSAEGLVTEQVYQKSGEMIELSLTLYLDPEKSSWMDHLKMYIASFTISSIFEANLENIKKLNEE